MLAYGWDGDLLLVQNSWGTSWGCQGRVRMVYDTAYTFKAQMSGSYVVSPEMASCDPQF